MILPFTFLPLHTQKYTGIDKDAHLHTDTHNTHNKHTHTHTQSALPFKFSKFTNVLSIVDAERLKETTRQRYKKLTVIPIYHFRQNNSSDIDLF